MFGFQMPDNFDFPEDLIQELRSSEKAVGKADTEPNESVNDDPQVRINITKEAAWCDQSC